MIDLNSRAEILRYHAENLRLMSKLERAQAKKINRLLNDVFSKVSQEIISHESSQIDLTPILNDRTSEFKKLLLSGYTQTATSFSDMTFKKLEQTKSTLPSERKDWGGEFWRAMTEWMAKEAAQKVVGLVSVTKRMLARVIEIGMKDGVSHRDIAKRILETGKIVNPSRALTIARTETHTVAVKSVDQSIAATKVPFVREWSSTQDDRTRIEDQYSKFDHVVADGEQVGQDEPFVRTGEKLMFPGDPSGSPGNIINCRCVILYRRP